MTRLYGSLAAAIAARYAAASTRQKSSPFVSGRVMEEMEQAKGTCFWAVERGRCAMQEWFLPIGIRALEDIRDRNVVYVDITGLVYQW